MKIRSGFICSLMLLITSTAFAQNTKKPKEFKETLKETLALGPQSGKWMDTKPGCQVWDPAPQEGETATWSGKCVKGKADGPGTLEWSVNGNLIQRVEGTLHNGKFEGPGKILNYKRGILDSTFEGTYVNGIKQGRGIVIQANGIIVEGPWVNDKQHGTFMIGYTDGTSVRGDFIHGVMSEELKAAIGANKAAKRATNVQQNHETESSSKAPPNRSLSNPKDVEALQKAASKYGPCVFSCATALNHCRCKNGTLQEQQACVDEKCRPAYDRCHDKCESALNAEGFCIARSIINGEPTGRVGICE